MKLFEELFQILYNIKLEHCLIIFTLVKKIVRSINHCAFSKHKRCEKEVLP